MLRISKIVLFVFVTISVQTMAIAQTSLSLTLDTTSLVSHPAGPFYFGLAFTDGSGIGDANNTIMVSNVSFGGGSSLGNPNTFGGASGSLESGITISDSSSLGWFFELFAPGNQLSFTVTLTSKDDADGIPDRLTFFILDSSGVPLPTKSPAGDYLFGADLSSTLPTIDIYGSDPSRAPTVGNPVSIPAPTNPFKAIVIDIKPGEDPARLNPNCKGTIPVAILSTATFDAPHTVDRASLRFGETGNEQSLAFCDARGRDVNRDGIPDLVCHFTTMFTGFQSQDTAGVLKGETLGGVLFQGRDSICVARRRSAPDIFCRQ